jgi:hypothetical protein
LPEVTAKERPVTSARVLATALAFATSEPRMVRENCALAATAEASRFTAFPPGEYKPVGRESGHGPNNLRHQDRGSADVCWSRE